MKERIKFKFNSFSDYYDCKIGTWNKLLNDIDDKTDFVCLETEEGEVLFAKHNIEMIRLEIIEGDE